MRKHLLCCLIAGLTILADGGDVAHSSENKILGEIAGGDLWVIEAAVPEAVRNGIDIDEYRITIMTLDGTVSAIFSDLELPRDAQGGAHFVVQMDPFSRKVISSSFSYR